ncbi:MAG: hypothetical protein UU52_C0030G0004 [Candidatus Levybacteria bacterium GW2011_GWB1_41_21]|nr:MAG: hypothetical protein UU52_C0030G0004 [Candidatus Levybacteria bacterium GW2011_GWB1_41_21]
MYILLSIVHFTPVYPEDLKEAQSKGYNCPMIKPILTFPFLWASSFVILIYSFTDSILQKMMAPFLIPSIIIAILCLVFIVYHSLKHTKSFFGFLRRLGIIFFLFFWIPVSVMAFVTCLEVFVLGMGQKWDIYNLFYSVPIVLLNIIFVLLILIRRHKKYLRLNSGK